MTPYLCPISLVENYAIYRSSDTMIIKLLEIFLHILMLYQDNAKKSKQEIDNSHVTRLP